ncbi:uncharacterized protein LOC108909187 [Anoplophora glabripennis]|uniref:uncharacterized protein LOC108909187 n=1 Tax=Anoplophora glabripennis TaxID=217634 RepID=UPI00087405A5|nr:uncharacterized protein LOC108909187 [Anoplophora glabripennis]
MENRDVTGLGAFGGYQEGLRRRHGAQRRGAGSADALHRPRTVEQRSMWDFTMDETPVPPSSTFVSTETSARSLANATTITNVPARTAVEQDTANVVMFEALTEFTRQGTALRAMEIREEPEFEFSGSIVEDPEEYINALEAWFIQKSVSPARQQMLIRRTLTKDAYKWFDEISTPGLQWELFKCQFLARFNSTAVRSSLLKQLYGQPQRPGETAYAFITAKWGLFKRLVPDTPEADRMESIRELLPPQTRVVTRVEVVARLGRKYGAAWKSTTTREWSTFGVSFLPRTALPQRLSIQAGKLDEGRGTFPVAGRPARRRSTREATPGGPERQLTIGLNQATRATQKQIFLACDATNAEACGVVNVTFYIQDTLYEAECLVIPNLREDHILGQPWLSKHEAVVDTARKCVHLGRELRQTTYWSETFARNNVTQPPAQLLEHVAQPDREQYEEILGHYVEVFAEADIPSTTISTQHRILLKDETPVRARTYRCSEERKRIINEEVSKMLKQGIVRRSASDYSSPIVIVKKRDGKQRFCVDYRLLNARTKVEVSQLPPIADTLMELRTAKVFTTLDLRSGYWQVPLSAKSKRYTAFSTPDGATYEFQVMPFGLAGAPGTFQKLMINVLESYVHKFVKVYLDDVIVYSDNHEEHRVHLSKVLERLAVHGLRCAPEKCQIATRQIEYLGHVITETRNLPQQEHLRRIQDFQAPRTR